MHLKYLQLAAILATAAPAFSQLAQSDIRTYHFVNLHSDMDYQEMVTTIRQVADVIPELPVDPPSRTLTISASPDKLAIVDWIVNELDTTKAESPDPGSAPKQHQFTAADGDVVDIFYLDPAAKPRDVQELLTVLRQVLEVNHLFTYSARKAIALKTPPDQARASEWLIPRLVKPDQTSDGDEYKIPGARENVVRILRWGASLTPEDIQQSTHNIRVQAKVSRLFTYFATRSLAVSATRAQLEMVNEIVARPAPPH